MGNKERIEKLEKPFKSRVPIMLFVKNSSEIPAARRAWEKAHGREIEDKVRVTTFVENLEK